MIANDEKSVERRPSDVDKWYRNYWARHQARELMYRTLRAPCLSSEDRSELNEVERMMFERTRSAQRLLDFGAGDNRLKRKFHGEGFHGRYETLDISAEEKHDYESISQVGGKYDAILCLEVVEHISLNNYVELMDEFDKLIRPGGTLIVSTPNPLCVVPMWAGDPGHVQQYPIADLAADFVIRGYEVEAFRVRYGAWPKGLRPRLRFLAMRALCYLLSVDYAQGLVVVGRKRPTAENAALAAEVVRL